MSNFRITRRGLLQGGIASSALGLVPGCSSNKSSPTTQVTPVKPAPAVAKKQKILILGGTGFLGPKTIAAAIARGHTVTIFNRGKREKFLPLEHQVEHLYGNRDPELPADDEKGPDGALLRPDGSPKGLEQLVGKSWDVVIDNSGYFPRMVKASAELLAKNAKRYIFISSISAYNVSPATGGDENTKLAELADPTVETMGKEGEFYGGLKVLCERAAQAAFPNGAAIVRPGFIIGPGDPTDRFTYWPVRVQRGGDVLAPGTPDDPLQWIDVRDLAEWLVMLCENETTGVFNAVGPPSPGRWGDVLKSCVDVSASNAKLEWVPADWLEKNGMGAEDSFPIWIPPVDKYAGFHRWSNDRAERTGLKFRSMDETVKSLLEWWPREIERRVKVTAEVEAAAKAKGAPPRPNAPDPKALRAGPSAEREQELLAKFKNPSAAPATPATPATKPDKPKPKPKK